MRYQAISGLSISPSVCVFKHSCYNGIFTKNYLFYHTSNSSSITVVLKVYFPVPWWFSRLLLGGPPAQSYFPNNTKALFAVFTFANLTVGKIAGALAGIKAVALNCTSLVYHLALEIKI